MDALLVIFKWNPILSKKAKHIAFLRAANLQLVVRFAPQCFGSLIQLPITLPTSCN
jgi:hypothetical protein